MKVPLRVPCASGSARQEGAERTVKWGSNAASAAGSSSRRNMLRANSACQASSVTTRTGIRWAGSAPA